MKKGKEKIDKHIEENVNHLCTLSAPAKTDFLDSLEEEDKQKTVKHLKKRYRKLTLATTISRAINIERIMKVEDK